MLGVKGLGVKRQGEGRKPQQTLEPANEKDTFGRTGSVGGTPIFPDCYVVVNPKRRDVNI